MGKIPPLPPTRFNPYLFRLYYNLQKDIELARLTARLIDYKDKVIIGEIYKYTSEELLMINAKVVVRNGTLYLVECNTAVHGTVCGVINTKIAIALDSNESKLPSACFISVGDAEFRSYVNMLECGTSHVKIPDGAFMASLEEGLPRISKWFVVEVGFRNEDFKDLLIEGSSWVNKYSDTEFCMILWIKEATRNGVQNVDSIKIVVFQRITRFYSDVPNPPKKECKRWSCEDQREALDKTKTQLQVELRCKIIHKQDVTDESIDGGEQVVVTLPTAGSERYFGEALFEEAEIELNLTDAFRIIFREIRGMRRVGTYPY